MATTELPNARRLLQELRMLQAIKSSKSKSSGHAKVKVGVKSHSSSSAKPKMKVKVHTKSSSHSSSSKSGGKLKIGFKSGGSTKKSSSSGGKMRIKMHGKSSSSHKTRIRIKVKKHKTKFSAMMGSISKASKLKSSLKALFQGKKSQKCMNGLATYLKDRMHDLTHTYEKFSPLYKLVNKAVEAWASVDEVQNWWTKFNKPYLTDKNSYKNTAAPKKEEKKTDSKSSSKNSKTSSDSKGTKTGDKKQYIVAPDAKKSSDNKSSTKKARRMQTSNTSSSSTTSSEGGDAPEYSDTNVPDLQVEAAEGQEAPFASNLVKISISTLALLIYSLF